MCFHRDDANRAQHCKFIKIYWWQHATESIFWGKSNVRAEADGKATSFTEGLTFPPEKGFINVGYENYNLRLKTLFIYLHSLRIKMARSTRGNIAQGARPDFIQAFFITHSAK